LKLQGTAEAAGGIDCHGDAVVDRAEDLAAVFGGAHADHAEVLPDSGALAKPSGYAGARDKGQLRLEGKEYIVKDGDVLVIRNTGRKPEIRRRELAKGAGLPAPERRPSKLGWTGQEAYPT